MEGESGIWVELSCSTCSHLWHVPESRSFSKHLRCPKCSASAGELMIVGFIGKVRVPAREP